MSRDRGKTTNAMLQSLVEKSLVEKILLLINFEFYSIEALDVAANRVNGEKILFKVLYISLGLFFFNYEN